LLKLAMSILVQVKQDLLDALDTVKEGVCYAEWW
jgi:hypothetical protein